MMCLQTVYIGKREKTALAKLPNMITCWKVVQRKGNQHFSKYCPEYRNGLSSFLAGWNKTKPFTKRYLGNYKIAFHAFRTEIAAKDWAEIHCLSYLHIVKCKTRKKDIVAIGEQRRGHLCLVTKRIWIPKPRKKPA